MVFELGSDNVMEYLWGQLEKTPDGVSIRYTLDDIDSLWWMGFVDTARYSLTMWREVFEPYRQPDGMFLLGHGDFLALDQYRYKGEIKIPLDAMEINEGKYTDEGLRELFDLSIIPSCSLSPKQMTDFINNLKKRFREPDGLIRMGDEAKREIKTLLDSYPSPLRNLEIIFDRMIEEGVDEQLAAELEAGEAARATTEAARQISKFSSMPVSAAEAQSERLKALEKTRPARKSSPKTKAEKPTAELKRIRRSRKGVRG